MGLINPTGHAAVYLDHVCADGPLHLRACQPGEMGVVISRYDGIDGYDWVAMPLIPYLYAVETTAEIPLWADRTLEERLRDQYRREHLEAVAPDTPAGNAPEGNWYELAGSAYDRTLYGFQLKTTPQQDAEVIALFNDRPNKELYNGMFNNCADFARTLFNRFYPHAIRRNYVADLGMTTPKSVARGIVHYAQKHPEAGLVYFRIPQVKGALPRSREIRGVTESLMKVYGLPLTAISPPAAGATLLAYVAHGRFAMPKDAPELVLHDAPARQQPEVEFADTIVMPLPEHMGASTVPVTSSLGGAPMTRARGMMFAPARIE